MVTFLFTSFPSEMINGPSSLNKGVGPFYFYEA